MRNAELAEKIGGADKALQRRIYYRLGRCYEEGIGTERNVLIAKDRYDKASKAGCALSKAKFELIEEKLKQWRI